MTRHIGERLSISYTNLAFILCNQEASETMKRLAATFLVLVTIYVIYFDLSHGTLPYTQESIPASQAVPVNADDSGSSAFPSFDYKVKAGDTALLIIEKQLNKNIPVTIDQLVKDFKQLNNGISPENIQIGKVYHFPDYTNSGT